MFIHFATQKALMMGDDYKDARLERRSITSVYLKILINNSCGRAKENFGNAFSVAWEYAF
jgi:hypothetical protein